jgi:hypothetical protein
MRLFAVLILAITVVRSGAALGIETPPESLLVENCVRAEAIIQGKIVSSRKTMEGLTEIELRVKRVYRGAIPTGRSLFYRSFRETTAYAGRELIVFLVNPRLKNGTEYWSPATEFSEFPYSDALAFKVEDCK